MRDGDGLHQSASSGCGKELSDSEYILKIERTTRICQ